MNLLLFPLWLASGALFPIATAHGWMQVLMRANPVTYMVAAVRWALDRQSAAMTIGTSIMVVGILTALLFALATVSATRKSTRSFA
jgi:ABC-2 type transport system permease protein